MFRKPGLRIIAMLLLLSFALSSTGCDNSEFKKRIADFQESVGLVSGSVGMYFVEMNQFERELYLQDVLLHSGKVVERGKPPTATKPPIPGLFSTPFNEDSIKARMDAISLLGRYGQRLAELAGTDAPERFNTAAQELGTNLFNLQTTFQSLAAGGADPTAKNFLAPIGSIVGAIGKLILEAKRDKKLRIAIDEAAPAVRTIIDQLETDLSGTVTQQRITGYSKSVQQLVVFYDCAVNPAFLGDLCTPPLPTLSLEQRRDLLNQINAGARRYELFKTNNPADVISNMRDAHEALVKYADHRTQQNLAALIAALDSFRSSAQQISEAVIQIRNLKRGES